MAGVRGPRLWWAVPLLYSMLLRTAILLPNWNILRRKRRIKKTHVRESRNLKNSGPYLAVKKDQRLIGEDRRYWAGNLPEKEIQTVKLSVSCMENVKQFWELLPTLG